MAMNGILVIMKSQTLNVNLTTELRRYVKDQVRSGRYQNENEVVRDSLDDITRLRLPMMYWVNTKRWLRNSNPAFPPLTGGAPWRG